jgi:hypothetical protein
MACKIDWTVVSRGGPPINVDEAEIRRWLPAPVFARISYHVCEHGRMTAIARGMKIHGRRREGALSGRRRGGRR